MRTLTRSLALVAAALVLAVCTPRAAVAQTPDISSSLFASAAIGARIHVTAADTSAKIDRAGYAGATYLGVSGHSVNAAGTPFYLVLQDSGAYSAGAWTAVDSVSTDTVENSVYKGKSYKGNNRYLRLIARAAASNDTTFFAGVIILSGKRSRP